MQSVSKDIVDLLDGESSLGLTAGTDLFYYRMPPPRKQINAVTLYDTPGRPPLLALRKTASAYYYSGVSVQVRNADDDTGYNLAHDIMVYLHGTNNVTLNGTVYTLIRALGDVQLLHRDENDHGIYVVNFEVQRKSA